MKNVLLAIFLLICFFCSAKQKSDSSHIFDADTLIGVAKSKGIKELHNKLDPEVLIYLDSAYASVLVELEFQSGFVVKHPNFGKVRVCKLPVLAIKAATDWNNQIAFKKLFDYYSSIPKCSKSDTIYSVYNNLDSILGILVYKKSPLLIEKLKQDYAEWLSIAQKVTNNQQPIVSEVNHLTSIEVLKTKTSCFYTDCYFVTLQIAGALNYLKVAGFDDGLIAELKKHQRFSGAKNYSFQNTLISGFPNFACPFEVLNKGGIMNFKNDTDKLVKQITEHDGVCCEGKISLLVYKNNKAYVFLSEEHGWDEFLITLKNKDVLLYQRISMSME